jgi:mRNA-degrading endonuclease RelE of RelBE toxin-antitoxin system
MPYPPLVNYQNENDYRRHFERIYCSQPIITFDGIPVRFNKRDFDHAFFETTAAKDDTFSKRRAARIDWIKAALEDPNTVRYVGWDNKKKRYDNKRRVTLVQGNYVVIFAIRNNGTGIFITAFVADTARTLTNIKKSPIWT